ncbi:unnamed protein product [Pieris brassicae]|uniref:Uncharacterized protein n=1 Tax=Pieris brassicae TaxID=7116 RepID=A0A9P0TPY2_PIEBR|nr:unnamed protein product [Pieris brassicae]
MLPRTPPKTSNVATNSPSSSTTTARRALVDTLSPSITRSNVSINMEMARDFRQKGLKPLAASRNLKGDLKTIITEAIDGLFGVVTLIDPFTPNPTPFPPKPHTPQDNKTTTSTSTDTTDITQLSLKLEANSRLLEESNRAIREHSRLIKAQSTTAPTDHQPGAADSHGVYKSYAKAAASPKPPAGPSIVVSGEGLDTTEQVIKQLTKSVNFR